MKVLKLSAHGLPQSWISLQEAALHYAAGSVRWESGSEVACFRGGRNAATGRQSIIRINSIIGTRGAPRGNPHRVLPGLSNRKLFARDRHICAYCGGVFDAGDLLGTLAGGGAEQLRRVGNGGGTNNSKTRTQTRTSRIHEVCSAVFSSASASSIPGVSTRALKFLKNASDSFLATPSIKRAPTWAILPPTCTCAV